MLMDPGSDYKIVDLNFKPLDRTTWNDIVEGQRERTNYVHLRLLRVLDSDLLNLQLAERKRQSYFVTTFGFLAMTFVLQYLQKKLARSRQDFFKQDVAEIQRLKRRIDAVKKDAHDLWRSRNRNRLLLYATKYYLLHPEERHRRYRWHPTTKGSSEKAGSNSAAQERDFKKVWCSTNSSNNISNQRDSRHDLTRVTRNWKARRNYLHKHKLLQLLSVQVLQRKHQSSLMCLPLSIQKCQSFRKL